MPTATPLLDQARAGRARPVAGPHLPLLMSLGLLTTLASVASMPRAAARPGEPVAIVFAPWIDAAEAATRSLSAGHRVLRGGRAGFIVVAAPSEGSDVPLMPAGAFAMLGLSGLAGCLDIPASGRAS